jgi:chromate transporter
MMLPGPEAQQLAIYTGWLLNGLRGGLVAGVLFVLPGMVALLVLSATYVGFGDTSVVTAVLAGLAPAVVAIVAQAVTRLSRRALSHTALIALAVAAFVALAAFGVPFPVVIAAAAAAVWLLGRRWPSLAELRSGNGDGENGPAPLIPDDVLHHESPSRRRAAKILTIGVLLWAAPVVAFALTTGPHSVFTTQGLFFSGTALVTFGGAYAVLSYVAQQAVETYGWLSANDMVRGLALAETTPGPLIMVVAFVGFVGGWAKELFGPDSLFVAGSAAAAVVTYFTFLPSFIFILVGAPLVETTHGDLKFTAPLTGITAAVVGVILNLAVFFAYHVLWPQGMDGGFEWISAFIGVAAFIALLRYKIGIIPVIGAAALAGLLYTLL